MAQQPIVAFVGAAGVHYHELCTGFLDQPGGGGVVGDVFFLAHAFHARALEARHQHLAETGGGDGRAHVRLPDVRALRGYTEAVGDGDRLLIVGVGEYALVQFCAARGQRAVRRLGMHGEHVRERIAAPCPRAHGFVGSQIEAHAERGRSEPAVEQRPRRNAKRQVHRLAKEGSGSWLPHYTI